MKFCFQKVKLKLYSYNLVLLHQLELCFAFSLNFHELSWIDSTYVTSTFYSEVEVQDIAHSFSLLHWPGSGDGRRSNFSETEQRCTYRASTSFLDESELIVSTTYSKPKPLLHVSNTHIRVWTWCCLVCFFRCAILL